MPSRTKRKRYRRKLAKATAERPPLFFTGELGQIALDDLATIRRAMRGDWDTPEVVRHNIMRALGRMLDNPGLSTSPKLAVCQTYIEAEAANQRAERCT